jgi:hypothetical protein
MDLCIENNDRRYDIKAYDIKAIENNDRRYDIKARSYFQYVKSGARLKERASGASLMRCA